MAIARGAGTEIIRTIHLEEVVSTDMTLIFGVQHHIYTVLSIIVYSNSTATAGDPIHCWIEGYDSTAGEAGEDIYIFKQPMATQETFVWNDKFSFNGHGPTDFAGAMDSIVDQDAIADQGGAVQKLMGKAENASDNYDWHITYIDQNNA